MRGWAVAALPNPELQASRAERIEPNRNAIIVPLTESLTSRLAVELARQIASERSAEIILAHVIEMPLAAAEDNGTFILEIGERMVKPHELPVESRLLRNQTTAQALLQLERETGAEVIVRWCRLCAALVIRPHGADDNRVAAPCALSSCRHKGAAVPWGCLSKS